MKTKEEVLLKNSSPSTKGVVLNTLEAMEEYAQLYAKQQAVDFFLSFSGNRDIPRHIIEKDYDIFIEQQNKEQ